MLKVLIALSLLATSSVSAFASDVEFTSDIQWRFGNLSKGELSEERPSSQDIKIELPITKALGWEFFRTPVHLDFDWPSLFNKMPRAIVLAGWSASPVENLAETADGTLCKEEPSHLDAQFELPITKALGWDLWFEHEEWRGLSYSIAIVR